MKTSDMNGKCDMRIRVKDKIMKAVDTFRYMGVDFASNGRRDVELNHRVCK